VVPFLKVVNDTAVAVNQGGKRKGAVCAYLETWHLDIEEFLELRKNTGDDRRRTHDMNTANWIPDLFMRRVMEKGTWTLFSPSDVPDLHDLFGAEFEKAYVAYEAKAEPRRDQACQDACQATDLWRKMLTMLFETGHPWITFKDACNVRSPQQHVGVVHSSNLCTEITLNTSDTETAVCNLGSVNLLQHLKDGTRPRQAQEDHHGGHAHARQRDRHQLLRRQEGARLQPAPPPGGPGPHGLPGQPVPAAHSYASQEAVEFADRSMEAICYYAYWASTELAAERGRYSSYKGSLWDRGILPLDTLDCWPKPAAAMWKWTARPRWTGTPCARRSHRRHAQLQLRGHRAHGHHLQHHRRGRLHRTLLRQPVGQVQPVGRVHRHQRVPGARPQAPGPVGRRDGHGPQALRRLAAPHRPRARRTSRRCTPPRSKSTHSGWWKPPRAARSGSTRRRA
jgi:hypothetical protein